MQHRTVRDVMSHRVVTVATTTPFKEIARMLADQDVDAVPVQDAFGRLVGIVSAADLLRKQSVQADPQGHTAALPLEGGDRARVLAEDAAGLMSTGVVTAGPDWSLVEAARVMEVRGIGQLPVADETGRLLGIVSRSDLLRAFLRADAAIRTEIEFEVLQRTVQVRPGAVQVRVEQGVVTLWGRLGGAEAAVVERLCRSVDGVVAVHAHLRHDVDDRAIGTTDDVQTTGTHERETTVSTAPAPLGAAG